MCLRTSCARLQIPRALGAGKGTTVRLPARARRSLHLIVGALFDVYGKKSYSQEGEDMILRRIFEHQSRGFYVDVGAHHPRRFSNTCFFYKQGWTGINIEPNPDAILIFKWLRQRDLNLQMGVSNNKGSLTYYLFDEPALNTFDAELARSREKNTSYRITGQIDLPVLPLADILERHLAPSQQIDFLSIDVEGHDYSVLQSNNWKKFRPTIVLVEALGMSLQNIQRSEVYAFLHEREYEVIAKTFNTFLFRKQR